MKIEQEMRFCFPEGKFDEVFKKISEHSEYSHSCHEMTVMYDNPNPKYSFYPKEVDGRLRLRYSKIVDTPTGMRRKNNTKSSCLLTWKRRLPEGRQTDVIKEEEIEVPFAINEADNIRAIFEDVLKCEKMSSYERIRHFFESGDIEVTLDEFPYGVTVELELKKGSDDNAIFALAKTLDFPENAISKLSCDDMYRELCNEQHTPIKSDILFSDKQMPKIR